MAKVRTEMAKRTSFWDEIETGYEIPPLHKTATSQTVVKYAGASGDFNPVHYDFPFARGAGTKAADRARANEKRLARADGHGLDRD